LQSYNSFAIICGMTLSEYLKNNSRAELASAVGVSSGMISQWLNNTRPVAPERCVAIEQVTAGAVTRKDLRPEDWALIWPELQIKIENSSLPQPCEAAA
jgi:DNA-binding transcriptional regulator YdaS (Cro superfamily)